MVQDWTSFTLKIGIKSSLKTMYDAWTKPEEIERWFLENCRFYDSEKKSMPADQNITDGGTYEWSWYLYDIVENGRIIKANGKDFIQFTFAGECLVDVKLDEFGKYVSVQLKQHNIPTDENARFSIRIGCMEGWTFYLTNLKSCYENGIDLRNKIPELIGINN